jgi:hypothetical protein
MLQHKDFLADKVCRKTQTEGIWTCKKMYIFKTSKFLSVHTMVKYDWKSSDL